MRKKNLSVNMASINPVPWLSPQPIVSNRETDHHKSIATTNVGYSLLKHSSYTHPAFTHSTNCPVPLQNIIGICYLGASSTSEQDTQQESTYLSQLLFDSDVYGIHNSDPSSNQDPLCSHVVRALLDFWNEYLSANPTRHILQCFYGDGCFAISKALEITPYKQKITVVGINSDCQINHTNAFSLQVPPSALNSNQTIRNPILSKGLLEAFYDAIAIPESIDLKTIPLSDRIEEHLLLDEDTSLESHENGASPNEWKLDRARHILNAALACLRLGGYSFLMFRNAVINTHVSRYAKAYKQRRSIITNAAGNTTVTFSSYPLTSTSQIIQKSKTITSHLATTLPPATAVPKISETDLRYIFPCGILTNGSFPEDRFPFGTYSDENPFPYAKYFDGTLTQHFNRSRDNTLPHPYGFTNRGHFLPRCSGKEVSMPYSCVSKAGQFNKTLFFGGGYINNEDPGEEIIYPCGISPNGTFTGQYLNLTVGEPYPYGQFPNEDFPYLSYFFNSSFNFMGEYNTNHGRPNSTLLGGHSFFRLNLTSRCDPDYGDDYEPVYVYLGKNRSIESTRVVTTIRLTRSEITTSLPYDTVTRQLAHIGLASNQSFLYFTGYWAFQGMCETALRFGYGNRKKIRALTFAANTSLVLGNLVDMTTNLQNICGATQGTPRDPVDLIVRGSICAYDLMNMASEISRLVIPVTSRSSRIANEVFSNIPSSLKKMGRKISGKITNLCNGYRKNARKFNQNVVSIGFIASSIVTATSIGGALLCDKISHSILPNVYYLVIESAVVSAFSFFFPHE